MEDIELGAELESAAPVLRLRRERAKQGKADASIYRYDRPALIAALAEHAAAAGGAR